MRVLRAVFRVLLVVLLTLSLLVVCLLALPFLGFPRRRYIRLRSWITNTWTSGLLRIAGFRIQRIGTPPEPPFLLVANHVSYVDPILIHSQVHGVAVSKAEVGNWPVIGWLARTFGTLFINRGRKKDLLRVNDLLQKTLDEGDGVIFFPEGTTYRGDQVYTFRASLLDLAARTYHPVHYAALSYRSMPGDPPAEETVCWWGEGTPFMPHLWNLLKLGGVEALVTFGDEPVQARDRKELAGLLEEQVRAIFVPIGTRPEPESSSSS